MNEDTTALGDTGVHLTRLTLGTWGLASDAYGEPATDDVFAETVSAALDAGILTLDTAPLWGDGRSERVVGEVLAEHPRGRDVAIIARLGRRYREGAPEADFSAQALHRDADEILERLSPDGSGAVAAIDVALLHSPGPSSEEGESGPESDTWAAQVNALRGVRDAGLARAIGASVQSGRQAQAAIDAGLDVLCLPVNPMQTAAIREVAERHENVSVIARSPLLHGLLTSSVPAGHEYPPDEHRRARWTEAALRTRLGHLRYLKALVGGTEQPTNMLDLAVRFAMHEPLVCTVAVGARDPSHVKALQAILEAGAPPLRPEISRSVEAQLALAGA